VDECRFESQVTSDYCEIYNASYIVFNEDGFRPDKGIRNIILDSNPNKCGIMPNQYVKHNWARIKPGRREESTAMLMQFFNELQGTVKGLRGYMILDNIKDDQESIVLTFWQTKEDMEEFYRTDNKRLSEFVERAKPMFEQLPIRSDHVVREIRLS
jgi:heme-degrading monooxygenase HmoA